MKECVLTDENKEIVRRRLKEEYPNAGCALEFGSPYELLVATMLSAQCTDVRVNIVTGKLFAEYNTAQKMLSLSQAELEEYIRSCGFYHSKASNILKTSHMLVDMYGGDVPKDKELLQKLPGGGRKTANVVCAEAFSIPGIAVDTHVFRVANRIGLTCASDELHTEMQLMNSFDSSEWISLHHLLIFHGRQCCKAQRPECGKCVVADMCLGKIAVLNRKQERAHANNNPLDKAV